MTPVTPCSRRSSSSTRSRNGRVPAFELLSNPTTRPSSVARRLAKGTGFGTTAAAGESNSIVDIPAVPPWDFSASLGGGFSLELRDDVLAEHLDGGHDLVVGDGLGGHE